MSDKHTDAENLTFVRRTITITPKINKWIQDARARMMQRNPTREFDYTTTANYLMAYGINSLEAYEISKDDSKRVKELIGEESSLSKEGLLHDVYETFFASQERSDTTIPAKEEKKVRSLAVKKKLKLHKGEKGAVQSG